jgi:xanthine/CO dehydrogenase XdhC/CoxF family maturation factor
MSVRRIIQAFDAWRASGQPIVLVTVYETLGSTYSKAGHRILIAQNGDYQGLVSGGCLEGDLAERAQRVIESGQAMAVTYDMRDEVDDLWGLGVGCNGLIRVLLQPLEPAQSYEPFASIAECLVANCTAAVATVIEAGADSVPGATLLLQTDGSQAWRLEPAAAAELAEECRAVLESGVTRYVTNASDRGVLCALLKPVPRLLVLGAGLDALPLVNMAADLGWFVSVADHRPAYVARSGFERAERVSLVEPAKLEEEIALEQFDAIIVMSHHLVTDRTYLSQLAAVDTAFLGVLGPPARRERLLAELGDKGRALQERLRGPVGLDIGADSPESIALSILAELQATLSGSAVDR